ncbi:MAG: hypothetical protein PHQ27_04305, partial [Victivallales bacterium]|nr:hypothetical protein [Victivallales bacterium]
LTVTGMTWLWMWRADTKSLWDKIFPGFLIAVICTLPQIIGNIVRGGMIPDEWLRETMSGLFTVLLSGILLPVLILLADDLSERLGLSNLERARENFIHRR